MLSVLAVLGLGTGLAACSDSGSSTSTAGSGSKTSSGSTHVYTEKNSDVTVTNGHTFTVALPVTTGTGYDWTAVPVPELQQMDTKQVQQANRPGAQATQQITFRAQGTGKTTLTLNYARPWETGVPPAQTANFQVTITG
ncbi:MAG: protease inhibitor I42 family protein [Acidimicrobiia bacterium]